MRINEKAQKHLADVYEAEETEQVFRALNNIDMQTLAALSDKDIDLFITDRNSRYCILVGGYIESE